MLFRSGLAAAALVAGAGGLLLVYQPAQETDWTGTVALLETTSWQAPSDALLPRAGRDLYSELPALGLSTELEEETLR